LISDRHYYRIKHTPGPPIITNRRWPACRRGRHYLTVPGRPHLTLKTAIQSHRMKPIAQTGSNRLPIAVAVPYSEGHLFMQNKGR
jgi:hypothetical protein